MMSPLIVPSPAADGAAVAASRSSRDTPRPGHAARLLATLIEVLLWMELGSPRPAGLEIRGGSDSYVPNRLTGTVEHRSERARPVKDGSAGKAAGSRPTVAAPSPGPSPGWTARPARRGSGRSR